MYLYHVIDTETSGLDSSKHDIAELAILTCNGVKIVDIFHKFYSVNLMDPVAQEINGLSYEMLKHFRPFSDRENILQLQKLLKYPIWAHNIDFDSRFLKKYNIINGQAVLRDSLSALRRKNKSFISKLPNNKLGTWLEHYGITVQKHTALGDAFGLYQIIALEGFYLNGNF